MENMKISQTLPQFNEAPALIVITGSEFSRFYIAHSGEVRSIDHFEIDDGPADSERGKYEGRAGDTVMLGRSAEWDNRVDIKNFLLEFKDKISEILSSHEVGSIYMFSPDYVSKELLAQIPNEKKDLLRETFLGNYADKHMFDLLQMIQKQEEQGNVEPKSEEAQKIYDKFPEDR